MTSPMILCTWPTGKTAADGGWAVLSAGGGALDAVEQACRASEDDPENMTVGRGAYPDQSGQVSLDASIMLSPARCGSVCYVRRLAHPVTLARRVMERTPHKMLAGEGAERFAREQGMAAEELETDKTKAAYEKWRLGGWGGVCDAPAADRPQGRGFADSAPGTPGMTGAEPAGHDTMGALALDVRGVVAGACSTSGLPFKLPGRVGDSPIIGHGLYVDPRAGAAVGTGDGELLMGVCACFLAVELLRGGASPAQAARRVIERIASSYELGDKAQAALIVLTPGGAWSSAALRPGYVTAVRSAACDELVPAHHVMRPA